MLYRAARNVFLTEHSTALRFPAQKGRTRWQRSSRRLTAISPATAIEMARELEPLKPSWVEELVPPENLTALKKASEKITIPVATGERIHTRYEYRQLFELQAADIIQPDITHFGGLLETKKLAAWAETYYITE